IQDLKGENSSLKGQNDLLVGQNSALKSSLDACLANAGKGSTNIDKLVGIIETASPATVSSYRERLYTKMQEILKERSLDEGRILTEAALYAEKIAVDEETVRLRSHLSQFQDILGEDIPVGRKLDFLTQEINREVNTIGSKAQDISIAKAVIDLKGEIEKIREQIQNLE
ncbi:MAG: DUF1732 domain-containing protein, partial [Oscillospiraceae bacterium]